MRIVIDMQGAQTESRFRGIGRYTMALILALTKQANTHDIILVLNASMPEGIHAIRSTFQHIIPSNQIRIFEIPYPLAHHSWTLEAAEYLRENFLAALEPDIVLVTSLFEGHWANAVTSINKSNNKIPTAVILYDLIPFIYQDSYLYNPEIKQYYFQKIEWLKRADLLLAISESSKKEAIQYLNYPTENIINISSAIDANFTAPTLSDDAKKALFAKFGITKDFLLFAPGGFDDRKNFSRLFEAYSLLPNELRQSYQLIIVGKVTAHQKENLLYIAKQFHITNNELILTNYLSEFELISFYSLATLFVFPSLHEGFGLPVLEAMACGAAVITSNTSSLPEVVGNANALFDPNSVLSIRDKISEVLSNQDLLNTLKEHAKTQVKKFNWEQSAVKAIQAIEDFHTKNKTIEIKKSGQEKHCLSEIASISYKPSDHDISQVAYAANFNKKRKNKHLLLDISTLVHSDAKSGIQRVVRSLLNELFKTSFTDLTVYPIYYTNHHFKYASHFINSNFNINLDIDESPVDFRQDDIYLSLDLNMHLIEATKNIFFNLKTNGIQLAFVVYDIMPIKHPEWWEETNSNLFKNWLNLISTFSSSLVCISKAVTNDTLDWLDTQKVQYLDIAPTVKYFHLGADVQNSLPSKGLPSNTEDIIKKITRNSSFLMVGTIEPRKGHRQVLDAFELLWKKDINVNLVIVGKKGWLTDELIQRLSSHPQKNIKLFWLEGISDEFLEKVYDASTCLVAASEDEGFGLPLIEAAQHKIPIIARGIPVFREVAGEHAFYFDGSTPEVLAESVQRWLSLYSNKQHPTSNAMPWLTWKESAQQLMQVINQITCEH